MIQRIGYTGFGRYVPPDILTNEELSTIVDTSDEWIVRRTGIHTRHILNENETVFDMAVRAAREALESAGVSGEEIGDIRVGVNSWFKFPSLATQLQDALGARQASAADVCAGCAGFIYAVEEAHNKIFVEKAKYGRDLVALVVGVDALSYITDWTDRGTCVLFGDGAGAVVLRGVEAGGILAIHTHAKGEHGDLLDCATPVGNQVTMGGTKTFATRTEGARPFIRMDGPKVYGIAVSTMVDDVRTVIDTHNRATGENLGVEDISYVYPHQANLRIVEKVAERLGVPPEKVYSEGVVHYGNTSTASIPLGYRDPHVERPEVEGRQLEIDVAFGSGFASGAILREVV